MKRTLKRELKELEIVKREAIEQLVIDIMADSGLWM